MNTLIERMLASGPTLTDGAWGTQLQSRGLASGDCPDAWNLSHREQVFEVARSYVEAGSRVILTNTFGANRLRLAEYGLADQVAAVNRAGVEISRRAADGRARVFASVGPSGRLLLTGETTEEDLEAVFAEQARALAEAGAEALVVETMSDVAEARIAVAAGRGVGLPVIACLVFDAGKGKDRTMMGQTPEQVAAALSSAGADVIGSNCGQGIAGFPGICRRLRAATDRPIWIKANAGLPEVVNGRVLYRTTPEEFAAQAADLIAAGAAFIGGCCGTNPDFIRALARALGKEH